MAKLAFIVLAVALLAVSAQAACPDYTYNSSCNTGSCSDGGLKGKFVIPPTPSLACDYECLYSGTFTIDGQLPGSTETVKVFAKNDAAKCCQKCKNMNSCQSWQYVDIKNRTGGVCFTYLGSVGPTCGPANMASKVGGKCKTSVSNDPHLVGAQGAHFDFSGSPEQSYCLVTDHNLHVNMKMTGYLDERTESGTKFVNGKAVRTWIRELGVVWTAEGKEHKLRMVARKGKEAARGDGYLALAELDTEALPHLKVGDELALDGGLTMKMESIEKKGPYDIDFYTVRIGDLLDIDVRLRVANPLLQRPDDAEVHISLGINNIKNTEAIHGVLGQTYRRGREERALQFNKLVAALHRPVGADTAEGEGLLDGTPADYISTSVLSADCAYTAYRGHTMPTTVDSE